MSINFTKPKNGEMNVRELKKEYTQFPYAVDAVNYYTKDLNNHNTIDSDIEQLLLLLLDDCIPIYEFFLKAKKLANSDYGLYVSIIEKSFEDLIHCYKDRDRQNKIDSEILNHKNKECNKIKTALMSIKSVGKIT